MTVLATEAALLGDVLKWEETGNYSRDNGVAAAAVVAGEVVLGPLSAVGPMTADTDIAIGIAANAAEAGESVAVITRDAQVGDKALVIGGTATLAAVTIELAALGIIVREQMTDYSF